MSNPTEQFWKKLSQRFEHIWNFPNCIGAIDGKHISICSPIAGNSAYFNYKGANSIVLLALADANYKLIAVDVGSYGRNIDGNVFAKSTLGKMLESKKLNVPADTPLTQNGEPLPYTIVEDKACSLKLYLLRPYSRNS
ncbi:hypothetical protein RN001_004426 [Aquatica leii]|uniref:DDE Tnp4 domain-containing protein n=1 Tax=Aquatica leii TaxID=1421715 RepID=A0AAN7PZX4_9COLE|nr:hypothetical protein RN001_004426 [Aquatica leii]